MFDTSGTPDEPGLPGEWAVPGVPRPAVPRQPTPVPEAVAALTAAVQGLAGWQPCALDGEQALAAAGALFEAEKMISAACTRSLTDIEARQLHRLEDARSTGVWLREHGHDVPGARLTLARRLSGLPLLADELAAGRLSLPVVQRLQAALAALRPHLDRPDDLIDGQPADEALYGVIVHGVRGQCAQARGGYPSESDPELVALIQQLLAIYSAPTTQLARLEAALVLLAGRLDPVQLTRAVVELTDSLLPAQLEERNRRGELERGGSLKPKPDGSGWRLELDLDLEAGERAFAIVDAELRRDLHNPTDTARAAELREQGLDPYDPAHQLPEQTRPRSHRERFHDAMSRAFGRYLAADLGGEHDKAPVRIVVTTSDGTLDGQPGAPAARGASGAALPVSLVRQWACTSALTRLVLNLAGRVTQSSHTERTLTAHERRILRTQTGGTCQRRGCGRSTRTAGAIFHPHHANPWARTGRTSLADTAYLCDSCHSDVHHGHVITLNDGRRLGPDGWVE